MYYRTLKNKPASLYSPTSELSDIIAEFSESFQCDSVLIVNENKSFALITFDSVLEYYKKKQTDSFLDDPIYYYELGQFRYYNELGEFSIRLMNYFYDGVRRDYNLAHLERHCKRLSMVLGAEKIAFVNQDKFQSKMETLGPIDDIELYFNIISPKPNYMTFENMTRPIVPVFLLPEEVEEFIKTQVLTNRSINMLCKIEKQIDIEFNKYVREVAKLNNLELRDDLELDNATEIAQLFKISI